MQSDVVVIETVESMQDYLANAQDSLRVDKSKRVFKDNQIIAIYKPKENEVKTSSKDIKKNDVYKRIPCLQQLSKR